MPNSTMFEGALDNTGEIWEKIVNEILAKSAHIIALRGAGSFNGISITDANNIIGQQLIPRIESYLKNGPVSIIFDGDNDDPQFPDIGHVMGRLRDHFGERVTFYAVQVTCWYKYRSELPSIRSLHSAQGNKYRTTLFPEKTFAGEHDHFSQHERLVWSPKYEQWYIGACGQIASKQLADYSTKAQGAKGEHRALIFRATVSAEQEKKIRRKLEDDSNPERSQRQRESLVRRAENPYGLLCTPDGEFISQPEFANLQIEVI